MDPPPCRYFWGPNGCYFGDQCRFSHEVPPPPPQGLPSGQFAPSGGTFAMELVPYRVNGHGSQPPPPLSSQGSEVEVEEVLEEEEEDDSEDEDSEDDGGGGGGSMGPPEEEDDRLSLCVSKNCTNEVDSGDPQGKCGHCRSWERRLNRQFELKKPKRRCQNYPVCANDPEEHNFCWPCFYLRKIEFYQGELKRVRGLGVGAGGFGGGVAGSSVGGGGGGAAGEKGKGGK